MNKDELLNEFIDNPQFFEEKGYKIQEEDKSISKRTNNKLIKVVKMVIERIDNESIESIAKTVNKSLNNS
ncbi:hypothetical protein [Flavobacterium filum]|uniref:hypothetical protein n=1 Tax=Flavobacterium filum TaxID=370974 RepID=UPI0023F22555|nr:hypothetical protein [Flavobacterium filum]